MSSDDDYRVGALVKLCGLSARADLNDRLGFVEGRVSTAQDSRWMVRLDGDDTKQEAAAATPFAKLEVARVRPANLCVQDQILVHDEDGKPMAIQSRPGWNERDDWNKSAAAVYYQLARQQAVDGHFSIFRATVSARCNGRWHRFRPPAVVAARAPLEEEVFWDGAELSAAIRARLASDAPASGAHPPSVEEATIDWAAATEDGFSNSLMRVIARAHSDASVVHVALRTPENTERFTLMQAFSGNDPASTNAALGISGSMVICPTECMVFHRDNMIKLPTSTMSVEQASRKVAQIVREGVGAPCPICLDPLASDERPTVFLPCSCKGGVHSECLRRLRDGGCVACPLCRERIAPGAWGRALQ